MVAKQPARVGCVCLNCYHWLVGAKSTTCLCITWLFLASAAAFMARAAPVCVQPAPKMYPSLRLVDAVLCRGMAGAV